MLTEAGMKNITNMVREHANNIYGLMHTIIHNDAAQRAEIERLTARIAELEAENAKLRKVADEAKTHKNMFESFCESCADQGEADCEGQFNHGTHCSMFSLGNALKDLEADDA